MSDSLPLSDLINLIVLNIIPCNRMHTCDYFVMHVFRLCVYCYGLISELNYGVVNEGKVGFEIVRYY